MKPNRKAKKSDSSSKLELEEIIGLTTKNGNGLASCVATPNCAYLAGCVVVLYNINLGSQSHLMVSQRIPKPLSCLAMSQDGRFIAAGESGTQSSAFVWDSVTLAFISELKGHLHGVSCISFSPDGKHIVSVGRYIYLWEWRSGVLLTKLKASSPCSSVSSVSFSSNAKYIITAGKKHLKFWAVGSSTRTRLNSGTGSLAMNGKPINLGPLKGSSFISVASVTQVDGDFADSKQKADSFPIYGLTDAGILCIIDSGMMTVRKSVDLKVKKCFSLAISSNLIACACSNGIVQLCALETLKHVGSVAYSMAKNCHESSDIVCYGKVSMNNSQDLVTFPDAVACQFTTSEKLVVVYGDHNLHVWDIHDVNQATRCCVLVSHSACIWDIKNLCCDNMHDSSVACVARGCSGGVSFATCSADGTIRLWDLASQSNSSEDAVKSQSLRIEQIDSTHLVSAGIFERDTVEPDVSTQGFRSLAVSSDGKYLAAGDCKGNLHIYDLQSSECLCIQGAHDADILTLSFNLSSQRETISKEVPDINYFLASGGRDRIIHLYDVKRNFDLIKSIDDHSAAVTSVKISSDGCKILSCSADRSLVLRDIAITDTSHKILCHHHQMTSHGTVYDMAIDRTFEVVVTVGQDKKINTYNVSSGKLIRSYKQDKDLGDPIKVTMDPSSTYLVCSYSNKSFCIYDFATGQIVTQAMGHGEVITGVIFLPDCKHLVSVGGDSCLFVWKLPSAMASRMLEKMIETSCPLSPRSLAQPIALTNILFCEKEEQQFKTKPEDVSSLGNNQNEAMMFYQGGGPREASAFRFSISRLPKWAQGKVNAPASSECEVPLDNALGGSTLCMNSLSTTSPDTGRSRSSSMSQGAFSNFTTNKRWLSVYTVCMDLLNTPEMQTLMERKISESSTNLIQGNFEMNKENNSFGCDSHDINDKLEDKLDECVGCRSTAFLSANTDQCSVCDTSECCKEVSGNDSEKLHSDHIASTSHEIAEFNSDKVQYQDTDLFKQHFGSLSTMVKVERRKSSMRRYSTRYVLHWDLPGSCKRLFGSPVKDIGDKTMKYTEEAATRVATDSASLQLSKNQKMAGSCRQDMKNFNESCVEFNCSSSMQEKTRSPIKEIPVDIERKRVEDQKECVPQASEEHGTLQACREALLSLDAAAETAIHSFSKLTIPSSNEECLDGAGAKLFDDAAELIPSIIEKVNTVAKLVRCRNTNTDSSGSRDVTGLEQLLGTFAESLSDRVVEILEERNCRI